MASVTHLENYVASVTQSVSRTELAALTEAAASAGAASPAAQKLAEIRNHLAQADALLLKRQYQPAIDRYKLVQGIIYGLINPRFRPAHALRPNVVMPVSAATLAGVLDLSMQLLDVLPIAVDDPVVALRPPAEEGPIRRYAGLGLAVASELPAAAVRESQLAATAVERGQWESAVGSYKHAADLLAKGQAAPGEVAAQQMNLGAALVQAGRVEEAVGVLRKALAGFGKAQDVLGQAQVSFNLGAALARAGNAQESAELLQAGERLLARVQERAGANAAPALVSARTTGARIIDHGAPLDFSTDPEALGALAQAQGRAVTYRMPGKAVGWAVQGVETRAQASQREFTRSLAFVVGDEPVTLQWKAGAAAPRQALVSAYYEKRAVAATVGALARGVYSLVDTTLDLPHVYHYVIPLALGDCYHGLGEFDAAERFYLQAAGYQYINATLEAPALWQRLARNVLDWGDWLYKADEPQQALEIYRKVVEVPGVTPVVVPTAPLYSQAALAPIGAQVWAMLESYAASGVGALNPQLAAIVIEIRTRLLQISAGLDFLGLPAHAIPIWTFEYLQNVARYFAQKAAQAERDFISFQDRSENEAFTRQQLEQQRDLAQAERELARQQREAAEFERDAYNAARDLAQLRTDNAQANRDDYAAMSWERIHLETANAWYSSQNPWELDNTIEGSGPDAGRHVHEVIADNTRRRGVITRDFELASMGRQVAEMQAAEAMAQAQATAAGARVEAAQQMEVVAGLRTQAAAANLAAFDSQLFTPGVWHQMGDFMRAIAQSYFSMGLKIARMMQRAYNFEHDLSRTFVRADYSSQSVLGMLAADALLRDIDTFTFDLITTAQRKAMPLKQTISLAAGFPFLFETEFRSTGRMQFETRLEDFDLAHPGSYSQRIESVEVEVEGVLPRDGLRGALTNGGISRYRTPSNTIKFRVQPRETQLLSEYRVRGDAIVFPADPNRLKLFEGAGTAGTWTIEFPPSANDLDFRTISDVRVTFSYYARYDAGLAQAIAADLAALAGATQQSRTLPLRWTHPDLFFQFQATGRLDLTLTPLDFPYNHLAPQLTHLALIVMAEPGADPSGWTVRLGTPASPATVGASPNARGEIVADAGHVWEPLAAGSATGDYRIELRADENPALAAGGALDLRPIRNLVLILEYGYTPR